VLFSIATAREKIRREEKKISFLDLHPSGPFLFPNNNKKKRERERRKKGIKRTGFGIVQRVAKSSHLVPANRERGVLARDGKHAAGEQRRRGDALEIRRGLGS
jgi:hypothetical protein